MTRDEFLASPQMQEAHLNWARTRLHRMLRLAIAETIPECRDILEEDIRDLLREYPALADEEYVLC